MQTPKEKIELAIMPRHKMSCLHYVYTDKTSGYTYASNGKILAAVPTVFSQQDYKEAIFTPTEFRAASEHTLVQPMMGNGSIDRLRSIFPTYKEKHAPLGHNITLSLDARLLYTLARILDTKSRVTLTLLEDTCYVTSYDKNNKSYGYIAELRK